MRSKFKWIFTLLVALSMQFSFAQEKTVTGVVSDATGPLPGANVVVKGTTNGVSTDIDGKYAIKTKVGETLVFSFVGMPDQSKVVGASNTISVKLVSSATNLDEVVVTGLGIVKRKDAVTSTTSVVKAKELTQAGSPSVVQGLVGKVSGLQINTTANGVNASSRIVINGPRSITGNNTALVVIDNAVSSAAILNSLPPEIVEDITVLKGAQGAALYGEQGVNGVIVVTTKKGSASGKLTFDFNTSLDFQEYAYLPERQSRYGQGWFGEHVANENGSWGSEFDGTLQPVGLPQPDGSYIMSPYRAIEDNIGKFFQKGTIQQTGLSISGGNLKDGYALFSVNRQDREFIVKGDELNRTNFLFKAGKQFGKWFVEGNVQYFSQKQRNTTSALYSDLLQTASNIPIEQFSGGNINHHWTVYYNSPYWRRENQRNISGTDFFSGISTVKYSFNDNISASWVGNVRLASGFTTSYNNGIDAADDVYSAYTNRAVLSSFFDSTSYSRNIYSDVLVNFDYMLTDDISFKANLGNNIQDAYNRVNQVGGSNLDVDGWYNNGNVLEPSLASGLANQNFRSRRFSYFGSVDLGYKEYLYLNVTGRNDWTSVLAAGNRSFFYPSAGLSFIPTKAIEGLKGDVLNYAKFTVGLTRVGNSSAVGAYDIDQVGVSPTGFPFGDLASYIFNTSPTDANIRPEFVTTKDFGLSLGFFKDRLTLDAQYYIQDTKDMITVATASSASGLGSSKTNIGALETKGFNIDLGYTAIKGKTPDDFTWQGRVNLSHYKTIVTKVSDDADEVNLQSTGLVGVFATVGEEFPLIKGIGYQRDDAGHVIIDASTGTPLLSSEFIKLGKANPDYILGFSNSFSYKGLKFTAVCDYRTGHDFYSEVRGQLAWTGNLIESAENGRNGGFIFPNSVYESSPGVYTPNTSIVTGGSSYASYQTYFSDDHFNNNAENNVIDATAFKVRELALSYTMPESFNKRTGLTSLTFGINARNPFMILPKENRNYADPETSNTTGNAQGLANVGQYPYTRTYGFTLNVKF